ncbi:SAM-dependent methyltransferase [Pseudomonadota bacterium]
MWFDKTHDATVYVDRRVEPPGVVPEQPAFSVQPDVVADFTSLPFADESFDLVVFDPPHAEVAATSITAKKYGSLFGDWRPVITEGFTECWRVLSRRGTLVFKWNEAAVSVSEVLQLLPESPMFGHVTAKSGATKWLTFYKDDE